MRREIDHDSQKRLTGIAALAAGFTDTEFRCHDGTGGGLMGRRTFSREFKLEAVRLVREGRSVAQAARDLDVHENLLRKWMKEFAADPWRSPARGR